MPRQGKRLVIGIIVFGLAQLAPLAIPLVTALDMPPGWTAVFSALLLLGIPEAGILLSVAILGKEGFAWLKGKIFGFMKRALPPDRVGPVRHRIGVTLFVLPLLFGWLQPYLGTGVFTLKHLPVYISSDVMLVISFFVLGGDFWDKLRGLFLRQMVITKIQ